MKKLKNKLVHMMWNHLIKTHNVILEKEIIVLSNKTLYYKGSKVTDEVARDLRADATHLLNSQLWKMITEQANSLAYDRIINKSKDKDDLIAPKAVIYTVQIFNDIIKKLSTRA